MYSRQPILALCRNLHLSVFYVSIGQQRDLACPHDPAGAAFGSRRRHQPVYEWISLAFDALECRTHLGFVEALESGLLASACTVSRMRFKEAGVEEPTEVRNIT